MTTAAKVHRYDDHTPEEWQEFLTAMQSGEPFECDWGMFYYWLEVLPPVHYGRRVTLPNGREIVAAFGFAEGAEEITVFWRERHPGAEDRYFGCRTNTINPHA
jgi:hypothetical protein